MSAQPVDEMSRAREAHRRQTVRLRRKKLTRTALPVTRMPGGPAAACNEMHRLADEIRGLVMREQVPWATVNKKTGRLDRLARAQRAHVRLREMDRQEVAG